MNVTMNWNKRINILWIWLRSIKHKRKLNLLREWQQNTFYFCVWSKRGFWITVNCITDFIWNIHDPLKATLGDFSDSRNLFRRFEKLSEFKASDNIEIVSMNSSSFKHIPAWINGTPTPINYNVDIYYIFDVDTFKSSYGASLMTEIFWFDDRYSWNASEFSGPSKRFFTYISRT